MNRIEYIPGDLVNTLFGIAKITNVYKEGSYDFEGKSFSGSDTCEPIPLTPEILEKNGWKKERIYYTNKFIPRIKLCTCEEGYEDKWSVSINGDIIGGYIYHVHQLQHILFGLGLDSNIKL